ncbi:hypothetical protein BD413DRAFT_648607, partial [Trametes elegans]
MHSQARNCPLRRHLHESPCLHSQENSLEIIYMLSATLLMTPAARLSALDRTVAEIREIIDENAEHGCLNSEQTAQWRELTDALRRLRIQVVQQNTSGAVPGISSRLDELAEEMRRFKETCARTAAQYDAGGNQAAGHTVLDFSPIGSALFASSRAPDAAAFGGNAVALRLFGAPSDIPDVRPSPRLESATVEHAQVPVDEALCSRSRAVPSASDSRSTLVLEADNKSPTDAVSNAAQSDTNQAAAVKRTSTHKAEHSVVAESDIARPMHGVHASSPAPQTRAERFLLLFRRSTALLQQSFTIQAASVLAFATVESALTRRLDWYWLEHGFAKLRRAKPPYHVSVHAHDPLETLNPPPRPLTVRAKSV